MAEEQSDQRQIRRWNLIVYLRVWDLESGDLIGRIIDLSAAGFLIIGLAACERGRIYRLEIHWEDDERRPHSLRCEAECRWSKRGINPDFHESGFQLVDQSIEVLFPIEDIISDFTFDQ